MRFYERQEKETSKAWEAFKIYRDLGEHRSLDAAYRLATGQQASTKRASGRWTKWCQEHDWVARARAYDDYMEMVKQGAIEEHEKRKATELAERKARVEEGYVELQELALKKARTMLNWPLERTETEDGKTIIRPVRWSMNTVPRFMERLDPNPAKLALTDPTGEHEYRADQPENEDEAKRWFEEVLGVKPKEREE